MSVIRVQFSQFVYNGLFLEAVKVMEEKDHLTRLRAGDFLEKRCLKRAQAVR